MKDTIRYGGKTCQYQYEKKEWHGNLMGFQGQLATPSADRERSNTRLMLRRPLVPPG